MSLSESPGLKSAFLAAAERLRVQLTERELRFLVDAVRWNLQGSWDDYQLSAWCYAALSKGRRSQSLEEIEAVKREVRNVFERFGLNFTENPRA